MNEILSLLPALVAIIIALVTKRVYIALFVSVLVGGLVVSNGNPFAATVQTFDWIKDVMTDSWNARFFVLIALLGSGAAFVHKTGGSIAMIKSLEKYIIGPKSAQVFTWVLGLVVFFNDYVNSAIVGNATRDVTAKYKVSREKLAYLLDTTSAPVSTLGPVSDWIGYQVSLIAAALVALSFVDQTPFSIFLQSIPFNFYCILVLLAAPMIIMLGDFGPMAAAEERARTKGLLIAKGDTPLSNIDHDLGEPASLERASVWNFILPISTLILVAIGGIMFTGGAFTDESKGIVAVIGDSDVSVALVWASFAMTAVGFILALRSKFSISECEGIMLKGFITMLPAIVTITLAWTLGTVSKTLGTGAYVISMTQGWLTPELLPLLVFAIGMFVAFATGTSWGTMAILIPIAVPLAFEVGDVSLVPIALGAIFSGAVFGDHCSPISDTTVMSSIFSGSDHIAHVKTQIPYALVPAGISAVLYLSSSFIVSGFLLLLIGVAVQFSIIKLLASRQKIKQSSDVSSQLV